VPVSSASNTVTGVVPNLTFTLNGADKNAQVTIAVSPDTQAVLDAVKTFVDDYNATMKQINAGYAVDTTNMTAGPLIGDSSADIVQQQLLNMATYSVTGAGNYSTLASLGITMANDGTLSADTTKLTSAVTGNFQNFKAFFQGTSGFGTFFAQQLTQATDPTQGALSLDLKSISATNQSLQRQIDDLDTYIVTEQAQWKAQYERANIALQQLPVLQKQIAIQLGTYNSTSGQ
jgi:flagellar hook-associated protein 2